MLPSPVTAGALLLGALFLSVYYYLKSDPNQHQYQYSPRTPPQPATSSRPSNSRDHAIPPRQIISSCSICLGTERGEMTNLRCRHTFHNVCIQDWLRVGSRTCPVCRRVVS